MNVEKSLVPFDCNSLVSKMYLLVKQNMYFDHLDFMFMIVLLQIRILTCSTISFLCIVKLSVYYNCIYGKTCFAYNLKPYISAVRLCSAIVFQNTAVKL